MVTTCGLLDTYYTALEDSNAVVSLDPKPIPGDWNGAACTQTSLLRR